MPYCARPDVYALGLSPEAFARPPRLIEGVNPTSGIFLLRSHGLVPNGPAIFAVLSSSVLGAAAAAPPTGTSIGTTYYAILLGSSDTFQVASAPNGPPVALSDSGSGSFGLVVDHGPYLDAAIADASYLIDQHLVSYDGNVLGAPVLTGVCARLARRIYASAHASGNPAFAVALEAPTTVVLEKMDAKLMDLWLKGAELPSGVVNSKPVSPTGSKAVRLKGRGFLRGEREDEA